MSKDLYVAKYLLKKSRKLCRVCLTEYIENSKCLFEGSESSCIASMVMLCARVQIVCQDGLPDIICAPCLGDLEAANSFRVRCELADALLRKSYTAPTNKPTGTQSKLKQEVFCVDWVKPELEDHNSDSDTQYDPLVDTLKHKSNGEPMNNSSNQSALSVPSNDLTQQQKDISSNIGGICSIPPSSSKLIHGDVNKQDSITPIKHKRLSCTKCSFLCDYRFQLMAHFRTHTKPKTFQCEVCRASFSTSHHLKIHKMFCPVEKPLKCDNCQVCFTNIDYFKVHIILCPVEKPYKQNNTRASASNSSDQKAPKAEEKPYKCEFCGISYVKKNRLIFHLKRHTDKPHKCGVCAARFASFLEFNKHNRLHRYPADFDCSDCGKQFKNEVSLNRHKRIHSKANICTCEICGKQLSCKRILQIHIKRHKNIRSFRCEFCGRCFVDKGDLVYHAKMHTDPKKFECDFCGHKTRLKRALIGHLMLHQGEKNIRCQLCDYKCYNNPALQKHMLSHSEERKYSCPICDVKFKTNHHINRHMMRFHKIVYRVGDYTDRRVIK